MENRTYAIAVGLFTVLLGVFLLFSFWWLSGDHQKNVQYVVVSKLPVTGLSVESAVRYRGVNVGKVTDIALDKSAKNVIRIEIRVAEDLNLSKAATAELRQQGVTGLAYIDLNDKETEGERLAAGGEIPLYPSIIDKLLDGGPVLVSEIQKLVKTSNELAVTANRLLGTVDHEKFNQVLSNLEQASKKLDPLLSSATTSFEQMGRMASEENQALLADTLRSMQRSADAAQPVLGELNNAASDFRSMTKGIDETRRELDQTLNQETLPRIHELTENMNRDMRQFGHLLDTLEDNPQSVIRGKPPARPGPGESGFQPHN